MTGIVSALSGHFTRALVMGALFPVVLTLCVNAAILVIVAPEVASSVNVLVPGAEGKAAAVSIATILLTGALHALNTPIIRLYEGYPWQKSILGQVFAKRHELRAQEAFARWSGLTALNNHIDTINRADLAAELRTPRLEVGRVVNEDYPEPHLALPTRLGNVIRCFESYPERQYGITAVTVWPRLVAVLDEASTSSLDQAKSLFDFMIHLALLFAVSAVAAFGGVILLWQDLSILGRFTGAIICAGYVAVSYACYRGAIGRARAWGSTVKAAFDIHRWTLLESLGFTAKPATAAEERTLWSAVCQQMLFGASPRVRRAEYRVSTTTAFGQPRAAELSVTKGIQKMEGDEVCVTIAIQNRSKAAVKDVRVVDSLPAAMYLIWDSARLNTASIKPMGTGPYTFEIPVVALNEVHLIQYRMTKLAG